MNAKDKLIKARVQLQKRSPFFSYLTMHLNLIQDSKVPSMGVNNRGDLYYNTEFINSLSDEESIGVLCHEVMHVACEHIKRLTPARSDAMLANIAQDIVVNDLLLTNHFHLPSDAILPSNHQVKVGSVIIDKVNTKVWEEVYDELYRKCPKVKVKGFDKHIRDGKKKSQAGKSSKNGNGKGNTAETFKSKAGKPNWKRILSEACTYAKMQGNVPAGIERLVEELNFPKHNWRSLLQRYILQELPYDFTYNFPSKKSIVTGVFMPSVKKENLEIAIGVDTSGSISNKELTDFLSEIVGIVRSFESVDLTILSCDAEVQTMGQVRHIDDIETLAMKGGGGTDFRPVFNYLNENKPNTRLLIFFTDGYGDFPESESIKTLWVLTKEHCDLERIPFGEVIEVG